MEAMPLGTPLRWQVGVADKLWTAVASSDRSSMGLLVGLASERLVCGHPIVAEPPRLDASQVEALQDAAKNAHPDMEILAWYRATPESGGPADRDLLDEHRRIFSSSPVLVLGIDSNTGEARSYRYEAGALRFAGSGNLRGPAAAVRVRRAAMARAGAAVAVAGAIAGATARLVVG